MAKVARYLIYVVFRISSLLLFITQGVKYYIAKYALNEWAFLLRDVMCDDNQYLLSKEGV